jgi:hypothetical protein
MATAIGEYPTYDDRRATAQGRSTRKYLRMNAPLRPGSRVPQPMHSNRRSVPPTVVVAHLYVVPRRLPPQGLLTTSPSCRMIPAAGEPPLSARSRRGPAATFAPAKSLAGGYFGTGVSTPMSYLGRRDAFKTNMQGAVTPSRLYSVRACEDALTIVTKCDRPAAVWTVGLPNLATTFGCAVVGALV